ncbi:hypothetical protein [Pseudonocardia xishanensis]|uniref:Uncharacterized protein n=1 Tax=Pseudonocardia xishanensis TaxID=630995 RepID=A0ABP8RZJ0_9PSEU
MAKPTAPEGREKYRNPRPGVVAGCPSCGLWQTQEEVDAGECRRCGEDFTSDEPGPKPPPLRPDIAARLRRFLGES